MEREKPTSRKRAKAEKAGAKATFPFFRSALIIFIGLEIFLWKAPMMKRDLMETLKTLWMGQQTSSDDMVGLFQGFTFKVLSILGPALVLLYLAILLVNGLWKTNRSPKRNSLWGAGPSLYRSLLPLGGFLALLTLSMAITYFGLIQMLQSPLSQSQNLLSASLAYGLHLMSGALLLIGGIDYYLGKRAFEKSLSMTKEEVAEEMREECGNPYIKSAQREEWQRI